MKEPLPVFAADRLGDALGSLARETKWGGVGDSSAHCADLPTVERLLDEAERLGFEARPLELSHSELPTYLARCGPTLLSPDGDSNRMVAILAGGSRWCTLVHGGRRRVATSRLVEHFSAPTSILESEVKPLFQRAGLDPDRRERLAKALAQERLAELTAARGWRLEPSPGLPLSTQARVAGVAGRGLIVLATRVLASLLVIASWWLIGRGALAGSLDRGWLWAWALLLLTLVPLRAAEQLYRGEVAWIFGGLLKRRLLHGALRLSGDEIGSRGTGELLGRVIDSERIEALAMNGGLASALAVLELVLALGVMLAGATPLTHGLLLGLFLGVLSAVTALALNRRRSWTLLRLAMTHRLVEKLIGHRTRIAQEPRTAWHEEEDSELEAYARHSAALDRWTPRLTVAISRGFFTCALLALLPSALIGDLEPARLAVSLGGILLASGALETMVSGVSSLGAAAIAWRHVEPLYSAAAKPIRPGLAEIPEKPVDRPESSEPLLEADAVSFCHHGRGQDAVKSCSLTLHLGDRILLEGSSGSGKSTLAALLATLRKPDRGWIGLHGLDLGAWGERAWRRRVVYVPQFHDNHLVTGPLALNLLMGSRWPATAKDLSQALELCRELGLGPLVERMPAGLMQPVGDSGWQLSQGERTRIFVARALLRDADLVILDESLAGLDGHNLGQTLSCARRRAKTLLVIAHP